MSTFVIILLAAGLVYLALFHKPKHHSDAELKQWMSSKLAEIAVNVDSDIKKDRDGEYPHAGKQSFETRGIITYPLVDKQYARLDVSDKNTLRPQDIMATTGYQTLSDKVKSMNLTIQLEEKNVEGDDVESFDELDEYIEDFPRYYTVTISGW